VTLVDPVEQLRNDCRQKANYAFGTASIFERRMRRLERRRNWITYLGIVVPALVGSLVLSFGKDWLPYLAALAGIMVAIQLAISLWSIIAKWDDKYSYAVGAMQAQTKLFNSWERLAKYPPPDLEPRAKELSDEDERQENSDKAQNVSDKEKRYGLRKTLYQYGLTCVNCKIKPSSMKPSKCDTCGNF
jgi:mobilome CxxCx(11)CxxC protein